MTILKRILYLFITLTIVSVLVTSCEREFIAEEDDEFKVEEIYTATNLKVNLTNETIKASVNELNRFLEKKDLSNSYLDESYINNLKQTIESYTGMTLDYTTVDAFKVKSAVIDLFNKNDLSKALEHHWFPNDKKLLNLSIEIKEAIVKKIEDVIESKDIKFAIDELRQEVLERNLDEESLEFAKLQIDVSENILKSIYKKHANKKGGISCNWLQWICVGASTAAAVALIATGGGAVIAIIAGGGTVATVAACCICGCTCTFTDSCQDPDPCEEIVCEFPWQTCANGDCIGSPPGPCDGVVCPFDWQTCVNGNCVGTPPDPCEGVVCPFEWQTCVGGVCDGVNQCGDVICAPYEICINGNCVGGLDCDDCIQIKDCPPSHKCLNNCCVPI